MHGRHPDKLDDDSVRCHQNTTADTADSRTSLRSFYSVTPSVSYHFDDTLAPSDRQYIYISPVLDSRSQSVNDMLPEDVFLGKYL